MSAESIDEGSAREPMEFEDVSFLREHDAAWRLLRADNAPLILSFLHRAFVARNARTISAAELTSLLDDELLR